MCVFRDFLRAKSVNRIKLYKKEPNRVTGLLRKHTERDKAGKSTIKASVSIETGHCGHIEDLLKSLFGCIIPSARRRGRNQEQRGGGGLFRLVAAPSQPRGGGEKVPDAGGEAQRNQLRL